MRFLILLLTFTVLGSYACQRNSQHLFLQLDTQIYNSNFPSSRSVNDDGATTTLIVGTNGIQKVTTRSVDVDTPDGRFRLSLIDMNRNGLFGEVGTDLIVLSPYEQEAVPINLGSNNIGVLRPSNIIQVDRSFFLIKSINTSGEALELMVWERAPHNTIVAQMQTRMKQIPVHDPAGEEMYLSLRNESGKSTLLIVWTYQESSTQVIAQVQAKHALWQEDWQVISINMRDDASELAAFLQDNPLDFPTYMMSSQSCQVLDCHALPPYALLLDDKGRIVKQGLKAASLWSWLNELERTAASSEL